MDKMKYYDTRKEAENIRKNGDKIYFCLGQGYCIVPAKKSFWNK